MNVNTAIKNIKAELATVKAENQKFNNVDVKRQIKNVEDGIKELKNYIEIMLDMDNVGSFDYRSSMITTVNLCYDCLSQANFTFYMNCGEIYPDILKYKAMKKHYEDEETRLKSTTI
jgi:hypothetical protein